LGQGSIAGKKLLIIREHFNTEQLYSIEQANQCEYILGIQESLGLDFTQFDHLLCKFSLKEPHVKELFKKINDTIDIAPDFLISPEDLTKLNKGKSDDIKEFDQKVIDECVEKFPELFKRVDPNFFKNRSIYLKVLKYGKMQVSDLAIFDLTEHDVQILSKIKIKDPSDSLKLNVVMKMGNDHHEFEIDLIGELKKVELDIEDKDDIYCYEFLIKEENETYKELLEAILKQQEHLTQLLGIEEDDDE
jgi:hypothetical protein